jgi:sugar lactone lactonase YvrE
MASPLRVVADGFHFLEGPRWRDGRLWVSDMQGDRVVTVTPSGAVEKVVDVPTQPSGLGWLADGRLLVVSMKDRRVLRLEDGRLVPHADLSRLATFHANDMVVDRSGRAYVGNFGYDYEAGQAFTPAVLALVHPDGRVEAAADDLAFPNGMVITPDGKTLVVAETFAHRLTAFTIAGDGRLSGRRIWASLDEQVYPDGICLDAESAIWVASPLGNEAIRVREGGAVTDRVKADRHVIACALGGADGRTLFVMAAAAIPHAQARAQKGGCILAATVDVPGAGSP